MIVGTANVHCIEVAFGSAGGRLRGRAARNFICYCWRADCDELRVGGGRSRTELGMHRVESSDCVLFFLVVVSWLPI